MPQVSVTAVPLLLEQQLQQGQALEPQVDVEAQHLAQGAVTTAAIAVGDGCVAEPVQLMASVPEPSLES